ncbi:MAG TPA: hypothetical protein PLD47_04535 [Aggregatilineales bacterium]|nr:hypothetical protein [Anaerolineales bacterium]HRE46970.1 hypothetical protein [Aggregatilineales bacterium]
MPRPVTGRRPDSLFDNRYRYDHIYPRGRSGETLRAYDTLDGNAPVVIKRPALQDAPPIRAGQEVSILNERRALEALAGHPLLCELRHSGTFRVGGQSHHYIVMDMAQGETLEALTLRLSAAGEALPPLEFLNILDGLCDLLQAAHDRNIVYNDVDAKHLFWDQEGYTLKLIDWGNAVFLDSQHAGQHITKAADIQQVGQLIYFVLSGGHRLEMGRPDPANDLNEALSPRLKAIINRAVSSEPGVRYLDIAPLRQDLAEVRRPIQKGRDLLVERVRTRLPNATSKLELEELIATLTEAAQSDPGYPRLRNLRAEAEARLRHIEMQGDLDAVRIYIESGNFAGASALVESMIAREAAANPDHAEIGASPLLLYLGDVCEELESQAGTGGTVIPEGLTPALEALFRGDSQGAARTLITTPDVRANGRLGGFLLAERLARRVPGIVLLRPHLVRLDEELNHAGDAPKLLQTVRTLLRKLETPLTTSGAGALRRLYEHTADVLSAVEGDLKTSGKTGLAEVGGRARQAAEHIVELLEVALANVLSDSSRAGNALYAAAAIDPLQSGFEGVNTFFTALHDDLAALRTYAPAEAIDGIGDYLERARTVLTPYSGDVRDSTFQPLLKGLDSALAAWGRLVDALALGGKRPALDACRVAGEGVRALNPALGAWFEDYQRGIDEIPHAEALSPNAVLGKALAEGWEAWDRGKTADALQAGKRAADAAQSEAERLAARRLVSLSEVLDRWLEREGSSSTAHIEATQRRIIALFLPEEEQIRSTFAAQMPNMSIYLKAMGKGVIDPLRETSAAGVRLLFFDYILRGMVAIGGEDFENAEIWKDAAAKTFAPYRLHPAYQMLEESIVRRQLILDAVRAINEVRRVDQVVAARQAVRAPLAVAQLEALDQAIRGLEDALRRWQDGEFRPAKQLIDAAIERVNMAQGFLNKDLSPFRGWLQTLADSAEIAAGARRVIEQEALMPADAPNPAVLEAHQKIVDLTRRDLGEGYTAQLRQWGETYKGMVEAYTAPNLFREDKLRLMEGYFASLFIARQPALPIFRHWREVAEATPDPEPEPPPPVIIEPTIEPPVTERPERRGRPDRLERAERIETPEGDFAVPDFLSDRSRRARREARASREMERVPFTVPSPAQPTTAEASVTPTAASPAAAEKRGREGRSTSTPISQPPPPARGASSAKGVSEPEAFLRVEERRRERRPSRRGLPPILIIGVLVAIGAVLAAFAASQNRSGELGDQTPTAILLTRDGALGFVPTTPSDAVPAPTNTLFPQNTPLPSETPLPLVASPIPPSATSEQPVPTPTRGTPIPTGELVSISTVMAMVTPSLPPTLVAGIAGSPAPTLPGVILPTIPPDASSGVYDLLPKLSELSPSARTWDTGWFYERDGKWLIGSPEVRGGRAPLIRIGPDLLTPLIGTEAAQYIKRLDISMELLTYDKNLVANGLVYFGGGFESLQGQRASVEARLVQEGILDMGISLNARFLRKTQLPANNGSISFSIERNADRTLSLYLDGQLLGQSTAIFPPNVPLNIYLYVATGGVVVEVKTIRVQINAPLTP